MASFDPWFVAYYLGEALAIGVSVLTIVNSVENVRRAVTHQQIKCVIEDTAIVLADVRAASATDVQRDPAVGDETYTYTAQPSPDSSEADESVEIDSDESD